MTNIFPQIEHRHGDVTKLPVYLFSSQRQMLLLSLGNKPLGNGLVLSDDFRIPSEYSRVFRNWIESQETENTATKNTHWKRIISYADRKWSSYRWTTAKRARRWDRGRRQSRRYPSTCGSKRPGKSAIWQMPRRLFLRIWSAWCQTEPELKIYLLVINRAALKLGRNVVYRASHSDERLLGSCDTSRFNRHGKGTDDVTAELDRNTDSLFKWNKLN